MSLQRLVTVTLVVIVLLAACGGTQVSPTEQVPPATDSATSSAQASQPGSLPGGTITVANAVYAHSLCPNVVRSADFNIYRALFDTLTEPDATNSGRLEPGLAESWELIADTTWQFNLREDVQWHDGTPFTADDVVATLEQVLTHDPPALYLFRIRGVTEVEAVDEHTVNIHTETKNVLLPINVGDVYMHQAAQIAEADGGCDALDEHPIGTGLFKYETREEGVSVTLTRNPDYWKGPAQFETLVFRGIAETATRVAALESGEIDIAVVVPPDDAARLGEGRIEWVPVGQSMHVNLRSVNAPGTPLADVRVRQALNYGVDKDALIEDIFLGYAEGLPGQVTGPDAFGFNPDVEAYPYDPDRARELLEEAGYQDGFDLVLTTGPDRYLKAVEAVQAIAGQLRDIGINTSVETMEHAVAVSRFSELQAFYAGWNYFPPMDADLALQQYQCAGFAQLMCNDEWEDLFTQQRAEEDPDARLALLHRMQEIVHEEAPGIFLYQTASVRGVSERVEGFEPNPDDVIHFQTIRVTD